MLKPKTLAKIVSAIPFFFVNIDIFFRIGEQRPAWIIDYQLLLAGIIVMFFFCMGIYFIFNWVLENIDPI